LEPRSDPASTKKNGLRKGGRSIKSNAVNTGLSTVAIDDDSLPVVIDIPVAVTLPDHDAVVAIPVVTLPDNVTIAIAVTITVTGSDGHADRTDTDSNFFGTSWHRKGYSSYRYRGYYKTLDHRMLLFVVHYREAIRQGVNGSCWASRRADAIFHAECNQTGSDEFTPSSPTRSQQ
jgi:hypothetical protein